jgi:hypothetical protein
MIEFAPALVTLALSGFTLITGCGFTVKDYKIGPEAFIYDREQKVQLTSIFAKVEGKMGPTSVRLVTPEPPDKISREFVEDLANTGGPDRYDKGRLAQLAAAYRAHGKTPVQGAAWVVSVRPLVVAHTPSLRTLPEHRGDQAMHWSNLLYPLVTEVRLDLPVTHIVVLDERAWSDRTLRAADAARSAGEAPMACEFIRRPINDADHARVESTYAVDAPWTPPTSTQNPDSERATP